MGEEQVFYLSLLGVLKIQLKNHKIYSVSHSSRRLSSCFKKNQLKHRGKPLSFLTLKKEALSDKSLKSVRQVLCFLDNYFADTNIKQVNGRALKQVNGRGVRQARGVKIAKQVKELEPFLFCRGSLFQRKIRQVLKKIPYGKTLTYSETAVKAGYSARYSRAVGLACARNPFLILVPCHRVTAKGGLGGFALGLSAKQKLLTHERNNYVFRKIG